MRKQRLIACSAMLVSVIVAVAAYAGPDASSKGKDHAKRDPGAAADKPAAAAKAEGAVDGPDKDRGKGNDKSDGKDKEKDRDKGEPGRRHGHGALRELLDDLKQGKLKKADVKERLGKLRDNMAERRKKHQAELKERWGAALAMPAVREELQHHARRSARLNRALLLAETELTKDKDKVIDRIQKLIEKEQARHERAMERLKTSPAAPAASAAVPAGATSAASAPAAAAAKAGDQ
jgi:hypothetical protein